MDVTRRKLIGVVATVVGTGTAGCISSGSNSSGGNGQAATTDSNPTQTPTTTPPTASSLTNYFRAVRPIGFVYSRPQVSRVVLVLTPRSGKGTIDLRKLSIKWDGPSTTVTLGSPRSTLDSIDARFGVKPKVDTNNSLPRLGGGDSVNLIFELGRNRTPESPATPFGEPLAEGTTAALTATVQGISGKWAGKLIVPSDLQTNGAVGLSGGSPGSGGGSTPSSDT